MFFNKLIYYFYIFLTIIVFLTPINVPLIQMLPAVCFLWTTYLFFLYGLKKKGNVAVSSKNINSKHILFFKKKRIYIIVIVAVTFIPLYIKFYTGTSFVENILRFISGNSIGEESTYYLYQNYFKENNLNVFSLKKIPYIIGYGVLKFYIWGYIISTLAFIKKLTVWKLSFVLLLIFMCFSVGVSRGTSFELFELTILITYSLLLRSCYFYNKSWLSGNTKYLLYGAVALSILYFMLSKAMRYGGEFTYNNITSTLLYDNQSFIAKNLPLMALILNNLSGYFLFGLYFISFSIINIWFGSIEGLLSISLPRGVSLFEIGDSYKDIMCGVYIDCGAAWIPDSILLVDLVGLPLYFTIVYLVGRLSKIAYLRAKAGSIKHTLLLFVLVLFMFSLPVGNFITASSATLIIIILLILSFIYPFNLFDKSL